MSSMPASPISQPGARPAPPPWPSCAAGRRSPGCRSSTALVERTPDRELLPMAEGLGMGVALWSPLGGGFLTGKYRRGEEGRLQRMGRLVQGETTEQKTQVLDTVLAMAEELGVEPGQVAIAWLRHRAARSSTALIPILGANN